jgi:hypothetical protein
MIIAIIVAIFAEVAWLVDGVISYNSSLRSKAMTIVFFY